MVLECLATTAVFALTCGAVLLFMKLCGYEPTAPRQPRQPQRSQDRP
jgi:hypothetical protein